jgi:hypothetical protein
LRPNDPGLFALKFDLADRVSFPYKSPFDAVGVETKIGTELSPGNLADGP